MIPVRYIGPIHALGLMFREEGMRGLYRGYSAYLIGTSIYTMFVPLMTEMAVMNRMISGKYQEQIPELYEEVFN
jgi:hypothetical protein